MPRFAANLTMLWTELPLLERLDAANAAGFDAVEILFPYDEDPGALRQALERNNLELVLINLPAGDFAAGERGLANDPARVAEFRDGVARALDLAAALGCRRFNCLTGLMLPGVPPETQLGTAAENLAYAAEQAQAAGVRLGVEPLNPIDAPGFLLPTTAAALALLDRAGHPNLDLQYDVYHAQRTEGNVTATVAATIDRIGHVQIADSPDRYQPGTGEINYPFVLDALDRAGYAGWVSLEYKPRGGTDSSLAWLREWGYWP
ncbi:MAG: TIM barrel protein [Chloroflexota bacterium]|nr:TIM barrel protein [Chloroflexota bacterium]